MRKVRRSKDSLVYLGTIDDVVLRYPWEGIPITPNFLVDTIVDHVLFGAPLLINDGYLVNHPLARADLMKGERSLILALIRKGFIKVLTRVDDLDRLADMPRQMASRGVETFGTRISAEDWAQLSMTLAQLGEQLSPGHNVVFWPPVDMGDGFRRLVENAENGVATKGIKTLGLSTPHATAIRRVLFNVSAKLSADSSAARTRFEQVAKAEAASLPNGDDRKFVSEMMGLANEIYHFNFGISLDFSLSEQGLTVLAETRLSRAFDDFLRVEEPVLDLQRDVEFVGRPDLVRTISTDALLDIVDQSTVIGRAKALFQTQMRQFAAGNMSISEAQHYARDYENALIAHFARFRSSVAIPHIVTIGMNLTSALVGAYIGPLKEAAAVVGEVGADTGMGLLSTYVGEKGLLRVAERYRRKKLRKEFSDARVTSRHSVSGVLSAIHFDPAVTHPIASEVRRL